MAGVQEMWSIREGQARSQESNQKTAVAAAQGTLTAPSLSHNATKMPGNFSPATIPLPAVAAAKLRPAAAWIQLLVCKFN